MLRRPPLLRGRLPRHSRRLRATSLLRRRELRQGRRRLRRRGEINHGFARAFLSPALRRRSDGARLLGRRRVRAGDGSGSSAARGGPAGRRDARQGEDVETRPAGLATQVVDIRLVLGVARAGVFVYEYGRLAAGGVPCELRRASGGGGGGLAADLGGVIAHVVGSVNLRDKGLRLTVDVSRTGHGGLCSAPGKGRTLRHVRVVPK